VTAGAPAPYNDRMKLAPAALLAALAVATAGCGSSGSAEGPAMSPPGASGRTTTYESVGVKLTASPARYRPAVSRTAVLALRRRAGLVNGYARGKPSVSLHTVNGAYPAWVIAFRHPRCTAVFIYDLRVRIWTWNFTNCVNSGGPATCEGGCTPANQPALDAAASYAERVAGAAHVFSGVAVDDDANTVIVHLVHAPESVLAELRRRHPGIYLIHNDAPRSLHAVKVVAGEIDPRALRAKGIVVVQWGPTQDGHLNVGVSSSVAKAQAYFDSRYGHGLVRVSHAEPAHAL
jgi:hypothetical protein